MSIDIEDLLRQEAGEVARTIASRRIPTSPSATAVRPARGRRVFVAAAALAVASLVAIVIVAARDPKHSIEPIVPVESVTSTTVAAAGTDPTATAAALPATTAPPILAPPTTLSSPTTTPFRPHVGVPLESLQYSPGPVALGVVPDGYRPVYVEENFTEPPSTNLSVPASPMEIEGWSATFIRRPLPGGETSFITVTIEFISHDDLYWGYPDTLTATDVAVGPFVGRFDDATPGHLKFLAALNATQRVVIGGRATVREIETIAAGLQVRSNGFGAEATALPDGFELVDEGWRAWPASTADWSISYVRDQTMSSMVTVHTLREPRFPALMRLVEPESPELDSPNPQIVDVNGYEGVLSSRALVFDVSPVLQIEISRDPMTRDATLTEQALIDFAGSLVGITTEQLAELQAAAVNHPLEPTDLACTSYLQATPRSNDSLATVVNDQLVVPLGTPITVDVTATQPLANLMFRLTAQPLSGTPGADVGGVVLATLGTLTGSATVDLTWDGTLTNGEMAPAGEYGLWIAVQSADPTDINMCERSGGGINAYFKIPE